jgi:hypothetical protein
LGRLWRTFVDAKESCRRTIELNENVNISNLYILLVSFESIPTGDELNFI